MGQDTTCTVCDHPSAIDFRNGWMVGRLVLVWVCVAGGGLGILENFKKSKLVVFHQASVGHGQPAPSPLPSSDGRKSKKKDLNLMSAKIFEATSPSPPRTHTLPKGRFLTACGQTLSTTPSLKPKPVRTLGSTNGHTSCSFMANPPPTCPNTSPPTNHPHFLKSMP